jgi:energy-coupling factor transporter ATP-binding protein EcfA2
MRIEQILLHNFKLFNDKEIEFSPHFNVLIGDNATGKTTILDALAILLGSYFLNSGITTGCPSFNDLYARHIYHKFDDVTTIENESPVFIKAKGLIFADISGGLTYTGRSSPQSFKVNPLLVYRLYTDGRMEVVRGVDIVGTPLTSFNQIINTASDDDVFNGSCGAESGYIPVSAVSPSILVSTIEVEKKAKGQDKPPILPAPSFEEER